MKIAIACDHGAYEHKEALKLHLTQQGHELIDFGGFSASAVDYPDTVYPACKAVSSNQVDAGIVMCGTGIGASIVANKVKGIRCALVYDPEVAKITRLHNDTNVLAMGGRLVSVDEAIIIADAWLNTDFSLEERHQNRINKITDIESKEA